MKKWLQKKKKKKTESICQGCTKAPRFLKKERKNKLATCQHTLVTQQGNKTSKSKRA